MRWNEWKINFIIFAFFVFEIWSILYWNSEKHDRRGLRSSKLIIFLGVCPHAPRRGLRCWTPVYFWLKPLANHNSENKNWLFIRFSTMGIFHINMVTSEGRGPAYSYLGQGQMIVGKKNVSTWNICRKLFFIEFYFKQFFRIIFFQLY